MGPYTRHVFLKETLRCHNCIKLYCVFVLYEYGVGLQECKNTLVGDDVIRGVSGGQRKRVTTGQLPVLPPPFLFALSPMSVL